MTKNLRLLSVKVNATGLMRPVSSDQSVKYNLCYGMSNY